MVSGGAWSKIGKVKLSVEFHDHFKCLLITDPLCLGLLVINLVR